MGWLYGWDTRKELAEHLISGNGIKTLKHCFKGNNLWAVQEVTKTDGTPVTFIALYLLRGRDKCNPKTGAYDSHGWGYKDMDESAGPYYYNCPLSYLDMVPDPGSYATEWRVKVREHYAKAKQKLELGQMIRLYGQEYQVTKVRDGQRGYTISTQCFDYHLPIRLLKHVELTQGETA